MYEYKVVELREKLMGGKMSGDKLESLLNEHARQAAGDLRARARVTPSGAPQAWSAANTASLMRRAAPTTPASSPSSLRTTGRLPVASGSDWR